MIWMELIKGVNTISNFKFVLTYCVGNVHNFSPQRLNHWAVGN